MLVATPASDTDGDSLVVVDTVVVSDDVDVAVEVADTVGTEPVGAGVTTVAFAEIGPGAATEDKNAPASESADEAAADTWDKAAVISEATAS